MELHKLKLYLKLRKFEIPLIVVAIISYYLVYSKIPAGAVIFNILMTTLAMLNMLMGYSNSESFSEIIFRKKQKNINFNNILLYVSGLSSSITIIAILFKALNYPTADIMLPFGSVPAAIMCIITLILFLKKKEVDFRNLFLKLLFYSFMGFVVMLM